MIGLTSFHLSRVFCHWRFVVYFIPTEKWNKKKEISWWSSNIYFFLEYRFAWRQRFQNKFDSVLKRIWCCSFHGLRLCTHISNKLLHKTVPAFFLIMSCSVFIAMTRRVLKVYFPWKQWKADYSKNIWKEKNCGHGIVCLLVGYISV